MTEIRVICNLSKTVNEYVSSTDHVKHIDLISSIILAFTIDDKEKAN